MTRPDIWRGAHRNQRPHVVQLTDPDEIESVRSNNWNDIHGFEVAGVVYGYAYSVERWRKVRGEPQHGVGDNNGRS